MMKLIALLAAIFVAVFSVGLLIAAWPMLPIMALITVGLALVFAALAGSVVIYYWIGKAKLVNAQAFATILEAAKVADNMQAVALPTSTRLKITMLPGRPVPTLSVPTSVLVEAGTGPLELPTANFFDHVPADPFRNGELFLRLGMGSGGTVINQPITKLTHFLPAGKTNSGKSTFLRALAAQALIGEIASPGRARIALVDLTGITFNADLFAGLPQTWGNEVVQSADGAITLVGDLLKECERRARLYSRAPGLPESLPEYNAAVPRALRLPVVMVFIEEMSALSEFAGKAFLSPLKQLIWTARKFGLYLVNTGQDFRANVIDKSITDNSSSRFLFGGVDDVTARVIGFDPKLHRVSVDQPGRGLVMLNKQVQEFQALFLEKSDFVGLVNQLRTIAGLPQVGNGHSSTYADPVQKQGTYTTESAGGGIATPGYDSSFEVEEESFYPDFRSRGSAKNLYRQPDHFADVGKMITAQYRVLPGSSLTPKLQTALEAFQQGATSVDKLAGQLGCSTGSASKYLQQLERMGFIRRPGKGSH